MDQIYSKEGFIIFPVKIGYVIHNTAKEFESGHTHLKSLEACKCAIDLCIYKKVPRSNSIYFLTSLLRIANDKKYVAELEHLIEIKIEKAKNKTTKFRK